MMKSFIVKMALTLAALTPLCSVALNWKAQSPDKEKADLISYCLGLDATHFPDDAQPAALVERLKSLSGRLDWMIPAVNFATGLLARCEGCDESNPLRRAALEILDYPLHVDNFSTDFSPEESKVFNEMVTGLARRARQRVLKELTSVDVPSGQLRGWLLYNMGFALKGGGKIVLIDITDRPMALPHRSERGTKAPGRSWSEEEYREFAKVADMLLVTHLHGDHCSYALMRAFLEAGKALVLPCDPVEQWLKRAVPGAEMFQSSHCHRLSRDNPEAIEIAGVKVRNFNGHQGKQWPCNIYHLEIGGVRFVHNGDNYDREKEALLGSCPPADVIIASSWNNMSSLVQNAASARSFNFNSAMLIPSHENEMHHSVQHRESYRELYGSPGRLPGRIRRPAAYPLFWGESFVFKRR